MTSFPIWLKTTWQTSIASDAKQTQSLYLLLGLLGWILVVSQYPFDWELPEYANY